MIGHFPTLYHTYIQTVLIAKDDDGCSFCKVGVYLVRLYQGDGGSSQKDAKAGLQTLCSALPSSYSELVKEVRFNRST